MMMIDECRSHTYMTEQRKKIFDVDVIDWLIDWLDLIRAL
jgi:hypothetical protein